MRLRASLASLALVAGLVVVLAPQPAQATETGLSATASSSWQTNNNVRAIAYANGRVFVGGEFTSVRPPGSALGTGEVSRTYLAAFDSTTGSLITTWNPVLDASVWSLKASADGTSLYLGGDFTTINGVTRNRIAKLSTSTGAVDTTFKPSASFRVNELGIFGSNLYLAGSFGLVNNVTRNRAAAVNATTGALLPFDPNVTTDPAAAIQTPPDVQALGISQDGTKVYLGGRFTTVGGVANYGVAAVDSSTGAPLSFPAQSNVPKPTTACKSGVRDIITDATTVYVAAAGDGGGCFDGTFAANVSDGTSKWVSTCLGATETIQLVRGWLFKGSHAHDCSSMGEFSQSGNHYLLMQNPATGALGPWFPQTNATGVTQVGPLASATDGSQLFVGGDFTTVNGVGQQGLTRFAAGPETAPTRPKTPFVGSTQNGVVKVNFRTTLDLDDVNLTYRLFRGTSTTPIATYKLGSTFWNTPWIQYVDTTQAPGTQVTYRVDASDGVATVTSYSSLPVTVAGPNGAYTAQVQADAPLSYWRLDEAAGSTTAADLGTTPNTSTYTSVSLGQTGALSDGDAAASFNGSTSKVTVASSTLPLQSFSVETWIKTSTTRGGKIVGFGSSQLGTSSRFDRHLYMSNDGKVQFGVYSGVYSIIRSTSALNDNKWHHLVGTFTPGSQAFYVDGALQGTTTAGSAQNYTGYWRVGGDSLSGWPNRPTNSFFTGLIDDTAIYPRALTSDAVAAHYAASGQAGAPVAPVATNDTGSTAFQTPLTVAAPGVLGNDTGTGLFVSSSTTPGHGTVSVATNGGYTYTPAAGYSGTDSFTYTVSDVVGQTATATVTITVGASAPPALVNDSATTAYATTLNVAAPGVLGNDTGSSLVVTSNTAPAHGSATVNANGSYTYTPAAGYVGADSFTYTITDALSRTATATVSITVSAPPAPAAGNDTLTTAYQTTVTGAAPGLLSNDTGGGLSVLSSTAAAHGTATVNANGSYSYTPAAGYAGSDSFSYTIVDVLNRTATGTVSITVSAPGVPVATTDVVTTAYQTATTGNVLTNDSGTGLTVTSSTQPSFGTASVAANGSFTYTPAAGYSGTDSFTYTITDSFARTATGTVSITVSAPATSNIVVDNFTRTVTGGWGTADFGGAWGPNNASFSVNGTQGLITVAPGQTRTIFATGAGAVANVDASMTFSLDALPGGSGQYTSLSVRRASTSVLTEYRGTVRVLANGNVTGLVYRLVNGQTAVVVAPEVVIPGLTYTGGTSLSVRFTATGSNPTALKMTVWKTGTAEPAPQFAISDSAPELQGTGLVGFTEVLSGSATLTNIARIDNVVVKTPA